jgi:hypothetical protein
MKNKKKLLIFLKKLKFFFFKLVYKKVNKIIKAKNSKHVEIKKVKFNNNFNYNFFNIKNGRLYSDTTHDTAYIDNQHLIKEPSFQYRLKNTKIINGNIRENIAISNGTPHFLKKFKGTIFSLLTGGAGKNNYWHWFFDVLPRIAILEKSGYKKKINYYLLPSISKKYQVNSFVNLNISNKKLLNGNQFKHIKCENLLAVDHPTVLNNNPSSSITNIPNWIILWLRKKYIKKNKKRLNLPKRIFIDREKDSILKNRKIINNAEVKKSLQEHGFKSITLAKFDFIKQVEIFRNANFIVGLHGAGFANIVFSKKGTKILEIQSKNNGDAILNLAKKCRLNYKRIVENNVSPNLNHQNSHIKVDLNKLIKSVLRFK